MCSAEEVLTRIHHPRSLGSCERPLEWAGCGCHTGDGEAVAKLERGPPVLACPDTEKLLKLSP